METLILHRKAKNSKRKILFSGNVLKELNVYFKAFRNFLV